MLKTNYKQLILNINCESWLAMKRLLLMMLFIIMFPSQMLASPNVSTGLNHSLVISPDGQAVSAFGRNQFGQLGNGSFIDQFTPKTVKQLPNKPISQVSVGTYHSALLTNDGSIYTWGWNNDGQLGRTIKVTDADIITALNAILSDPFAETLKTAIWQNPNIRTLEGLLPYLNAEDRRHINDKWDKTLLQYRSLKMMNELQTSQLDLVVRSDRSLKKDIADLVTKKKQNLPGQVSLTNPVKAIASGDRHNIVVTKDGYVWTWGDNRFGQLGDHTTTSRPLPVKVDYLKNVKQVAAKDAHSLALIEDGTVWAWGQNWSGIFGNDVSFSSAPIQINDLTNIKAISSGKNQLLLLKKDGTVWTLDLKNETAANLNIATKQIPKLVNIVAISSGDNFHLALKNDGTVWAWGDNRYGQLGDGTTVRKDEPIQIPDLKKIKTISAGPDASFAIDANDMIYGWGSNRNAQLSLEKQQDVLIPKKINFIWIKSVSIYPSTLTLKTGEKAALQVYPDPANAQIDDVKWESANSSLVFVDQAGNITACTYCGSGTTTITVTVNGRFKATSEVKVIKEKFPNDLQIYTGASLQKPKDTLWLGLGEKLSVHVKNQDKVIWTSSDPSVKVGPTGDSSVITATAPGGKATITATSLYENNNKVLEDSFQVKTYPWKTWEKQTTTNVNKVWQIHFSKALDSQSITSDTVYILNENRKKVATSITTAQSSISVTPMQSFEQGKHYTLYVSKNIQSVTDQIVLKNGIKMAFDVK